ncbi:hypothetical protein PV08_02741 [Exophiala spinifera]|uniref:Zn(2)-C6 fungal-type domain-containing protein n=1 Tax=Exophiala spinifera TaxID=91928 RepID=A0A0D2BHP1_9EURO|nr:uncharacterized protein PV08_02741 [Exophiala spinifera]KIW18453.1 hypothetical protein PV08_02741 [Exophiala spinifera]
MVFCGKPSKGCQRCRRRKVKCDATKPTCVRCQKAGEQCHYRNFDEAIFRNQTSEVVRKFKRPLDEHSVAELQPLAVMSSTSSTASSPAMYSMPSASVYDIGANFFFDKFMSEKGTFFGDYSSWLGQLYSGATSSGLIRTVIEAVGLSALFNVSLDLGVQIKSSEQYSKTLAALKLALDDPEQAKSDDTLLAITLLILFEMLNFRTWQRHRFWEAHVNAALALLELRGQDQFQRQRGGQLYIQVRSQILLVCMQKRVVVPRALVQTTYDFHGSLVRQLWQKSRVATPSSITEICFRVVNLRAALCQGQVTDWKVLQNAAIDIDNDLESWKAGLPSSWKYSIIHGPAKVSEELLQGVRHIYPTLWVAEAWNNWRILRLLVKQMMLEVSVDPHEIASSQDAARQLCTDVCISVSSFTGSPSFISLMHPLYLVALESLNPYGLRVFAIEQLRCIDASFGVRQARLLADTAESSLLDTVPEPGVRI